MITVFPNHIKDEMDIRHEIKCVVWDLDNTLWDGILSEGDEVKLRPQIQEILKTLDTRGILNSIVSKNNYEDAYSKLKEFQIEQYFLYPQIGWNNKSSYIGNIQKALNIGMNTLLFIDDQMFELDEVKSVHADVNYMNATEYLELLDHPYLNPKILSVDSKNRRRLYQENMVRQKEEEEFEGTSEEFLKTLNMEFIISEAEEDSLSRVEELTIRTNQLNSTGRTFSYEELNNYRLSDQYKLFVCELKDKYGTYGKIGIALVELEEKYWHIRLLIMSCRVVSRGVGTIMLNYLMQKAKEEGKGLLADFKNTDRNKMMYVAYRFANFKDVEVSEDGYTIMENDLEHISKFPDFINVTIQ